MIRTFIKRIKGTEVGVTRTVGCEADDIMIAIDPVAISSAASTQRSWEREIESHK